MTDAQIKNTLVLGGQYEWAVYHSYAEGQLLAYKNFNEELPLLLDGHAAILYLQRIMNGLPIFMCTEQAFRQIMNDIKLHPESVSQLQLVETLVKFNLKWKGHQEYGNGMEFISIN